MRIQMQANVISAFFV